METYKTAKSFQSVTVSTTSNIYFDGKVISRAIEFADGSRKTLGIIFPGSYKFDTAVAERMEISAGVCTVQLAGSDEWTEYQVGSWFDIPANSSFEIAVADGVTEYICSYEGL